MLRHYFSYFRLRKLSLNWLKHLSKFLKTNKNHIQIQIQILHFQKFPISFTVVHCYWKNYDVLVHLIMYLYLPIRFLWGIKGQGLLLNSKFIYFTFQLAKITLLQYSQHIDTITVSHLQPIVPYQPPLFFIKLCFDITLPFSFFHFPFS